MRPSYWFADVEKGVFMNQINSNTGSDLVKQVNAAVLEEEEKYSSHKNNKRSDEKFDSEFINSCIANNERGDGVLFAELNRGKFIYNATSGEWLLWVGHYWERDFTGRVYDGVELVAMVYVEELTAINRQISAAQDEGLINSLKIRQKKLTRRINRLRSVGGRKNTLEMAATVGDKSLVVTSDRLDVSPWLLACQNCVIDLRTGESRPGLTTDFLTKAVAVDWPGLDAEAPSWEKFMLEIMDGNQPSVEYLRRVFGYGITGLTREHIFIILFGAGRNGKGTMSEVFQKVLGPMAGPIQSEMLLNQGRVRSSAGPSPDIMTLRGLRLAFASETEQNQRFSGARVKSMSSSDTLIGRNPHDRDSTTFSPSHLLILGTNFKPRANPDDRAFWDRLHLVKFPLSFVDKPTALNERPIDRALEDKLMKEGPQILAWLVRGCLEWQQVGLKPPPEILSATAEYRRAEDDLADFIEEKCLVNSEFTVTAKAIYTAFKEWYQVNISDKTPTQKRFGDALGRRFEKDQNGPGKTVRYLGIGLLGGID